MAPYVYQMTRGTIFDNAAQIVTYLIKQFGTHESPEYHIKEITVDELKKERAVRRKKVFKTIIGSASWHVMVFKPGQSHFLASPRLCICEQCIVEYGSCDLFSHHQLYTEEVCDMPLCSDDPSPTTTEILGSNEDFDGFIVPGTYVAVAADRTHEDVVWFVKVTGGNRFSGKCEEDDYNNVIPKVPLISQDISLS